MQEVVMLGAVLDTFLHGLHCCFDVLHSLAYKSVGCEVLPNTHDTPVLPHLVESKLRRHGSDRLHKRRMFAFVEASKVLSKGHMANEVEGGKCQP